MAFLVGGGLAERLGARGEAACHFADLVHRSSRGVLHLVSGLASSVLHLPGDLPNLICHSSQQIPALLALLVLLALSAFAHLLSSLLESLLSRLASRIARVTLAPPLLYTSFRPSQALIRR